MKRALAVHWIMPKCHFCYVFCGMFRKFVARRYNKRRDKVTCRNCIRLMKLHGHLEVEP